jgi:hypothetical protein
VGRLVFEHDAITSIMCEVLSLKRINFIAAAYSHLDKVEEGHNKLASSRSVAFIFFSKSVYDPNDSCYRLCLMGFIVTDLVVGLLIILHRWYLEVTFLR